MIDLTPLLGPQNATGQKTSFRVFPRHGGERWLLDTKYRKPWHLETWPQANLRARVIYRAARLLGYLGIQLPSRRTSLIVADGSLYQRLRSRFDTLGVFLGTPGPNRKFVVYANDGDKSWFIKVPISPATVELTRIEAAALNTLAEAPVLSELVPRHFWIGDALAIEDVRPGGATFARLEDSEVLRVHDLLFARSCTSFPLDVLQLKWEAKANGTVPHADHDTVEQIGAARKSASGFLDTLARDMSVECYDAHGDFTRWNVLRAPDGSARIIDWEMFGIRPKFFDPFHYFVSQAILVDRQPAEAILERAEMFGAGGLDRASRLQYFGIYVANQVYSYSLIYEHQHELHPQARWQLHTWTELLTILTNNRIGEEGLPKPAGPKSSGVAP